MTAEPFLRTTWTDPVTARHGYLVIDRLVGGMSGGGTRMREGCTLEEVERLAHAMTLKNGGLDLPVGGAKLGLDMDPHDPVAGAMLVRFLRAMRPFFETWVATGEDMGTSQAQLIRAFEEAGIGSTFKAALNRSPQGDGDLRRHNGTFGATSEGMPLIDLVGGYGVTEAATAAMAHLGWQPGATRAAIQGFGSMGGSSARYLARKGVRVVAVADAGGTIANPDGLDVEHYLAARNAHGEIDRGKVRSGDQEQDRGSWLHTEAELLVPAAVADTINEGNCEQIGARLVVEAANIPTTAGAEKRLAERGVLVIPDFIANAGTNGWAWWVLLGMVEPGAEAAFAKIAESMRATVGAMLRLADQEKITPRAAAVRVALANSNRYVEKLGGEVFASQP
ncbi:MAG: glutamate dehydrogenase [Candidatus Dormibacteraeota bacterium]|nr:glutamate dehydrogenase [Candidatus Dormibacteraeota bacterium]